MTELNFFFCTPEINVFDDVSKCVFDIQHNNDITITTTYNNNNKYLFYLKMESNKTSNQVQPQTPPLAKFDITKLVAGTIEHRRYHRRRADKERTASGKIKVSKEQQKKNNIRKRLKQHQLGIKQKRNPVTKEKQKENVERAKMKRHQKKEKDKLLRMEANAGAVLSALLKRKRNINKDEASLSTAIDVIYVLDHTTRMDPPYIRQSEYTGPLVHHQCAEQVMNKTIHFSKSMFSNNKIQQIHHVNNPHINGIYDPFYEKRINTSTCDLLNTEYLHNPKHPLIATSKNGIDIIFIPSILFGKELWKDCLSSKELTIINDLMVATNNIKSLLDFPMGEKYTIKTAFQMIASDYKQYHHAIPHLRYSYHCVKHCAAIYMNPNRKKRTVSKRGEVIERGNVQLVKSVVLPNSPKEAFGYIVAPLAKIAEFYLLQLPDDLFQPRHPDAGTFFGCVCTYLSLNMYHGSTSWNGCPQKYYHHQKKGWFDIGPEHEGLYLHKDGNNYSFGAVLIFGADFDGFDQHYVTYKLRLPTPGWSLVLGDYRNLLHAVSKSNNSGGLRFSLVIANHKSTVLGLDEYERDVTMRNKYNYK
jgi:hypothetical protein